MAFLHCPHSTLGIGDFAHIIIASTQHVLAGKLLGIVFYRGDSDWTGLMELQLGM